MESLRANKAVMAEKPISHELQEESSSCSSGFRLLGVLHNLRGPGSDSLA